MDLSSQNPGHIALVEMLAFVALLSGDRQKSASLLASAQKKRELTDLGWLVLGYLKQGRFDLEGAQAAYRQALNLNPNSLPAQVQLAGLLLHEQQLERAESMIKKVLEQEAGHVEALNLLGFIRLAENNPAAAGKVWKTALSESSQNARAHFGLSLAQMRQGRVQPAMQSMAVAILLDPQRATYLSYWGKMLFQVRRFDKALTVLDSAIRLDPQDPTPLLYKAIVLHDLNRTGEALQYFRSAMVLNDNHATYGSRALLDNDQAVRNIDFSRMYSQFGLGAWARKTAMDSIYVDFSNPSAHIFNMGVNAAANDAGNAQANERLLSRLLQPININSFSRFNGYADVFELPGDDVAVTTVVGNHGQAGIRFDANGAVTDQPMAWELFVAGEQSDGWRDTNGDSEGQLGLTAKWQLNQNSGLVLGISVTDQEQLGEPESRFEIDADEDEFAKLRADQQEISLGLHHRLNSSHDLLAYMALVESDGTRRDNFIENELTTLQQTEERLLDAEFEEPYTLFQLQGMKRIRKHQLIYGALLLDGRRSAQSNHDFGRFDSNHNLVDPLTALDRQSDFDLDISLTTLYVRDLWQLTPELQLDVALYSEDFNSADAFTGAKWSEHEIDPRLGISWQVNQQHSLRLASFEYLLPIDIARLDPMYIAGIPYLNDSTAGSSNRETDLVWDFQMEQALLSTRLFTIRQSITHGSTDDTGSPLVSTSRAEKEGISVELNKLLSLKTGLNLGLAHFDISDQQQPQNNRDEIAVSFGLHYVDGRGYRLTANHIYRDMQFDAIRKDEQINVTNLLLSYEYPGKQHYLQLELLNLADEKFNWVTDSFISAGIAPERMFSVSYRFYF